MFDREKNCILYFSTPRTCTEYACIDIVTPAVGVFVVRNVSSVIEKKNYINFSDVSVRLILLHNVLCTKNTYIHI